MQSVQKGVQRVHWPSLHLQESLLTMTKDSCSIYAAHS